MARSFYREKESSFILCSLYRFFGLGGEIRENCKSKKPIPFENGIGLFLFLRRIVPLSTERLFFSETEPRLGSFKQTGDIFPVTEGH